MVRTVFFTSAAFLVFCLIAAASTPASAQVYYYGDSTIGGSDNSGIACNSTHISAIRYNTGNSSFEGCNGAAWSGFGGCTTLDCLTDARADRATDHNLLMGNLDASYTLAAGSQFNVAVGEGALIGAVVTAGGRNTAIGYQALKLDSASYNTAVGFLALTANTTGLYNNAFGAGSGGPTKSALVANSTGSYNNAFGSSALGATTGSNNTAIGHAAGYAGTANTTGSSNTYIGYQAGANANNYTNSTALGANAVITASNDIVLGDSSIATIHAQVTSITAISDRRLKKDIQDSDLGLAFIEKLRPVSYRFKSGDDRLRYGFIAQEVETALDPRTQDLIENHAPEKGIAMMERGNDKMRTYHLNYGEMFSPLVKAVQELSHEMSQLVDKFHALEKIVTGLAAEFNPLKKTVAEQQATIAAQQVQINALAKSVEELKAGMQEIRKEQHQTLP